MSIQSLKQHYTQVNEAKRDGFSQNKYKQIFNESIMGEEEFWDSFAAAQWTSSSLKDTDAIQLFLSFLSYGLIPNNNPHYESFLRYATSEKNKGQSSLFNTIKSGNGAKLKNALNMNDFKKLFYEVYPKNKQLFTQIVTRFGKIKAWDKNDANNITALVDSILRGTNVRAENE